MTELQATSQVVDAAVRIVRDADLRSTAGGTALMSCENAVDPPYRATVHMTFVLPQGNSVAYLANVAAAMTAGGWAEAATPAEHFGHSLTRDGLHATFYRNPENTDLATMRLTGECRVVAEHRDTAAVWTEVTDRLRRAG